MTNRWFFAAIYAGAWTAVTNYVIENLTEPHTQIFYGVSLALFFFATFVASMGISVSLRTK